LPVFVEVGGNVATTAGSVHTLTGNGTPLEHCVIDSTNSTLGTSLTYRGGVIVIPKQPLQVGVKYVVSLTVNGAPYTWSFTVGPFNACVSVAVGTNPPSPILPGGTVAVTAAASGCPDPNPLYQFWLLAPGGTAYQLGQSYSTNPIFTWTTVGLAPGTYRLSIWARDANSTGVYGNSAGRWDAYDNETLFTLSSGTCGAVSVSDSPASPAVVGTAVAVTAQASGCQNPNPLYQFWVLGPGATSYQLGQAYSTSPTLNWNSNGLVPGTYRFSIWARDANSSGAFGNSAGRWDAYNNDTVYTLKTASCSALSVSMLPASQAEVGTAVILTASVSGCADPSPVYQFFVLAPGSSAYQIAQAYSTSPTLNWNTAGLVPGTYRFSVWARDAKSTGAFGNSFGSWDAYDNDTVYTLSTCSALSVSVSPASPVARGTITTITAHASGCANPVYQFWILVPGASSYQLAQAYSTNATLGWNTSGAPAGTYRVSVWVRDANSGGESGNSAGRWDTYNNDTLYTLT
jgi:hypothetical protein